MYLIDIVIGTVHMNLAKSSVTNHQFSTHHRDISLNVFLNTVIALWILVVKWFKLQFFLWMTWNGIHSIIETFLPDSIRSEVENKNHQNHLKLKLCNNNKHIFYSNNKILITYCHFECIFQPNYFVNTQNNCFCLKEKCD